MSRTIGYARVSTVAQDLQLQLDALSAAGCEPVFTDHASGAKSKRPGLDACVEELKARDTLVVWRLDLLGRSMPHLFGLVEDLLQRGVGFRSLQDGCQQRGEKSHIRHDKMSHFRRVKVSQFRHVKGHQCGWLSRSSLSNRSKPAATQPHPASLPYSCAEPH